MSGAIFDQVRIACASVAQRSTRVRIDATRLNEYALSLPLDRLAAPALDPKSHFIAGSDADSIAFFLTLDAINFGSGYFPHLKKRPGMSGYFTVATCLTERYREIGPISPQELAAFTESDCRKLTQQVEDSGPVDELMQLFARALNDLGQLVQDEFGGRFETLVDSANHSADALARVLARMPLFQDVSNYNGLDVPFYKRAQLTAADLNLALAGKGLGQFDDLNRLTIFADNLVPHVLRCDGVLRYDADLAGRIDAGDLLVSGSTEEVEIRACAVHAAELIVEWLHESTGRTITPMQIDYLLWNRGQEREYKARPRHRARSVYY